MLNKRRTQAGMSKSEHIEVHEDQLMELSRKETVRRTVRSQDSVL